MIHQLTIKTPKRAHLEDITAKVQSLVDESGVKEGLCVIFVPHTTAAVTINENADPDVVRDMLLKTGRVFEKDDPDFRHAEGNSDSHIKTTLTGNSETVLIDNGRLVLGTWQGIYFAEYDGPRTRKCFVKILKG